MNENRSSGPPSGIHQWLRGIRPLLWWLLFAFREHQRLCEQTHLTFSPKLQGRLVGLEAAATIDNKPFVSGDRVPLGWHRLTIFHPKTEPFAKKLFIWYGEHDLGDIALTRGKGTLEVHVEPMASVLSIRGSEFSVDLTNSSGMSSPIPTDHYVIEARFPHWSESKEINAIANMTNAVRFNPTLGAFDLKSNRGGASFQILDASDRSVEVGDFPASIAGIPEGTYKLIAWHDNHQQERKVVCTEGATNAVTVSFMYGTAILETEPSGAIVEGVDGARLGVTPLQLSEVPVGQSAFVLRRDGCESVSVALEILSDQTNRFRTNLVNINLVRSLAAARQFFASGDYDRTIAAASDALAAKPGDADAQSLKDEAIARRGLRSADAFSKQGNYAAGIKALEAALMAQPNNEKVRQMLADFEDREDERFQKQQQTRLDRPVRILSSTLAKVKDADLFENHELTARKTFQNIPNAIVHQLRDVAPAFQIIFSDSPEPETFRIEARQEFPGGSRVCFIVGGQLNDRETKIVFRVLEFKTHYKVGIPGIINVEQTRENIPVHPSRIPDMTDRLKAQVDEGATTVTERLRHATQGIN